jgi:hypothetical protein
MKNKNLFLYIFFWNIKVRVFDDIIEVKSDDSFLDNVDFE